MRYMRVASLIGFIAVGMAFDVIAEEVLNKYMRGTVEESYYDPSPRPGFNGGTFVFRAKFVNKSDLKLASLAFRVLELSGGNQLISVDDGESGLLTSKFTLPIERNRDYEDGVLDSGEQVSAWFRIALKTNQRFQFHVDAEGIAALTPYLAFLGEGAEFQRVVDSYPGETTFVVRKGEHRKQSVIPREGNVFVGEDGAVMNGSVLLSKAAEDWIDEGQCWSIEHVPVTGNYVHPDPRFCQEEGGATCRFPEDLYLNDTLVEQVESESQLTQFKNNNDRWLLDYTNRRAYICLGESGGKPWDHVMEISYARFAFGGGDQGTIDLPTFQASPDVVVRDLTIEKYAVPIQWGAVGYQHAGEEWLIENNEVKQNHAGGIAFAKSSRVTGNFTHDNGEIGIKTWVETSKDALPLTESIVTQNVIEKNGRPDLGYIVLWEGGGTKFSHTKGLRVDRNWVKNNGGPGLWADINNCDMSYLCNVVEGNRDEGIYHEISYSTSIVDNIVRRNGSNIGRIVNSDGSDSEPTWASQILISTSSNAEVKHNFVETDDIVGNGITLFQAFRNGDPKDYCTGKSEDNYYALNNKITKNQIIHRRRKDEYINQNVNAGITGGHLKWSDFEENQDLSDPADPFWTTNHYDGNTFHVDYRTEEYWYWNNTKLDYNGFVAAGNQQSGSKDNDLTANPVPGCFNTIGEIGPPRDFQVCLVTHDQMNFVTTGADGVVRGTGSRCGEGSPVRIFDVNGGELVDGDIVYIRALSGNYWSADQAGNLTAKRQSVGTDEQFQIHKVRGKGSAGVIIGDYDQVALESVHEKWVVAENGGGSVVRANRPDRSSWETFTLITKR